MIHAYLFITDNNKVGGVVDTLLHEMIHAYLFITDNNKVGGIQVERLFESTGPP